MNDETNDDIFDTGANLRERLVQLNIEHDDLDNAITRLQDSSVSDELVIRRMKKRKLALKDRIAALERILDPGDLA
ncbi:MAG: YdcH family protein [Azoarcus sp.]|nr:YdcH family protein [Azoarcus sp.]